MFVWLVSSRRLAAVLGLLLIAASLNPPAERPPYPDKVMAQQPCIVTVHGVELTQSIQKAPFSGAAGVAVTLIAGRMTTARVYVTSTCSEDEVVAWMNLASSPTQSNPLQIDAQGSHPPIEPPTSSSQLANVRAKDDNRAFAFRWRLPSMPPGDQTYDIKVYACSLTTPTCATLYQTPRTRLPASVWSQGGTGVYILPPQVFKYKNTPQFFGVPVNQENPIPGGPLIKPDGDQIQPGTADQMMRAVLPIPWQHPGSYNVTTAIKIDALPAGGLSGSTQATWPAVVLEPTLCANDRSEHRSDYLIALVPPNIFGDGGAGGGHAANYVAAVDVVQDNGFKSVLAHEVQHAMGFDHDDSMGSTNEIGWDVYKTPAFGAMRVRLGNLTDLIDGGGVAIDGTRWMSKENTNSIIELPGPYRRQNCVRGLPPAPNPLDYLLVIAGPSEVAPFAIEVISITALNGPENLTPMPLGEYSLRLVDQSSATLYASGMIPTGPGASSAYHISVPDLPATARIELLHQGVVQDVITRSTHAPSVVLQTPLSSSTLTDTTTVTWTAVDNDGDALVYDLYWRPEGAVESWEVIAIGAQTTTLQVETRDLPAGATGTFRLVARDGLNRAEAMVNGLTLANHAPQVAIVSPLDGEVFTQGEFIDFLSRARDVDELNWSVPSVTWTSSLDGVLSTNGDPLLGGGLPAINATLPTALSIGTHVLTVEACDSTVQCVTDSVTITVAP